MRNFFGGGKTEPEATFLDIPNALGGRSSGSSGSGARRRVSFSDSELGGTAFLADEDVKFAFEEKNGDERVFEFRDNGEGGINFTFTFDQLFVRLRQSNKGKTQLIWIDNDKANVYVGDSFSNFIESNRAIAEQLLFPLFDRLGVKMPIEKVDTRVVAAVIEKLKMQNGDDAEQLKKLIADLDSDSYETRAGASEKLAAGYDRWQLEIKKYSEDASMSTEAKVRLKEIIADSRQSELDKLIADQNLLASPAYLISIVDIVKPNEKQLLFDRLEKVTGQKHGDDLAAWKSWLKADQDKKRP